MASTAAPVLVERADIHKSCKSLEVIVSVLANYTEAANMLATVQKKLAKALKEAANVKGTNNVPANAMLTSAGIFEGLAEVDVKFARIADKEAENIGSDLKKWFKKMAKEEKAHDERITSANARIKQAGQVYEKKAKRKDRDAAEEHSRYVAVLNSVGPEMSQDKYNHSLFITQRHTSALSGFAASLSRLAEAEWIRACEHVRRSAPSIGNVGEWRVLCEGGWSGPVPGDLPDLSNNGGTDPGENSAKLTAPMLPLPTTIGTDTGRPSNTIEYPESPTSSSNSKLPSSTHKSSEVHPGEEQSGTNPTVSRPPSPPATREAIPHTLKKKTPNAEQGNLTSPPTIKSETTAESGSTSLNEAPASLQSSATPVAPSKASVSQLPNAAADHMPQERRRSDQPDQPDLDPDGTIKPESKASHLPLSQDPLPPPSSRNFSSGERENQINVAKKLNIDLAVDQERERQVTASPEDVKPLGGRSNTNTASGLDRRLSVESTMSSNSLVAIMRDHYDTRPMKPSSPPPRDLPRLAHKVTDLASRYTAVDTPTSPSRSSGSISAQSGLSGDRFPTFQDRYPRSDRDKDRFRAAPESPVPDKDYFGDRDKERYRYLETPTVDRNQFLRDDRDRERYRPVRPRSPDRQYFDELGMRDRQRRIETVEELVLQEREANLREQELQLEIERAKLANARESGYASDTSKGHRGTSPYGGLRRSESPGPMTSQQSLRPPQAATPYDHSPNCGCQRCSAQHYASTPSLPRTRRDSAAAGAPSPIYKPDPPIMLRPEKPKNWIRRMSMPVASLVSSNDKKSVNVQSGSGQGWTNMPLPDEDGRVGRRSFEFERDQETTRFGGTTRR